jgi:ABC-type amino acid transport substrate-binding protein
VLALLQLALKNSGKDYQTVPTDIRIQQEGVIRDMVSGQGQVDFFWTMSTDEREKILIPVRIPLDKGLIGWRVALVNPERAALFKNVKTIKDLRAFKAGQESGWPDVQILQSNGLEVVTASSDQAMFSMLQGGRFDYFPRSVIEILGEVSLHSEYPLEVERNILLHYPAALYFFVTPHMPELAEALRTGLEKAVADGSYERLFQRFMQPIASKLELKRRRVIELSNPLQSNDKMPLNRPELWYRP